VNKNLSDAQESIKKSVKYKAWLFSAIIALGIGFFSMTFLPKDEFVRIFFFCMMTVTTFFPVNYFIYRMLSSDSRCEVCEAPFAIKHIDSQKKFLSAIPRNCIKNIGKVGGYGPDVGKQVMMHESWTEERYEITDTYECTECGDTHQSTRMTTQRTGYSGTKTRQ